MSQVQLFFHFFGPPSPRDLKSLPNGQIAAINPFRGSCFVSSISLTCDLGLVAYVVFHMRLFGLGLNQTFL